MALNKNPLRVFKSEHIKRLCGFTQMSISVGHFWDFTRETLM
jgi:hypothetical protein